MTRKLEGKIALITGGSRRDWCRNRQTPRFRRGERSHHLLEGHRCGRVDRQGD